VEIVAEWKELIEQYLLRRSSLTLCFLILDARRGWTDKDLELRDWLEFHNRRYIVIATKTDKLKSQSEQRQQVIAIRNQTAGAPLSFSAVKCRGAREIWQAILKTRNQRQ
jgi:GTP-binding protein